MDKVRVERIKKLSNYINTKILVLDGATGTALQHQNLTAKDFGGGAYEGCNEHLLFSKPDAVTLVHNGYLDVGADIIETNSFGSTPIVLGEYNLQRRCYDLNFAAAKIARNCADKFGKERFVAGSIGPTTKAISVTGGISFETLVDNFFQQAKGLYDGGVDYFLVETSQDTRNIKAAIIGINKFFDQIGTTIPIAISSTIERSGTMLAGQDAKAFITSLKHLDLLYIGLNCATGPAEMREHIRTMSEMTDTPIGCVPNAGLPDENGHYLQTPEEFARILHTFVQDGLVNLVGGCCGTTYAHIAALVKKVHGLKPARKTVIPNAALSGIENLDITDEARPILVGERTNSIGSKKFRDLIAEEKFDEAAEIAKLQVQNGAQVIDVCLGNPDRDELADVEKFYEKLIHKIKVPIMIDSTDPSVIEKALTYSQGKAIINSINLENGEERFQKIAPLAKRYGAALVVGMIDENPTQGMAVTRERKLEIAKRSHDLLVKKYHIPEHDIYFDPLVFPCATGDSSYTGSAVETIEGIRLIKSTFPNCKSAIGVSNVSFGLPQAGREALNSVFLYHCVKAGLDLAIVNTEKIKRFGSLPQEEITLSENLLWNKDENAIVAFADFYRNTGNKKIENGIKLPPKNVIQNCILNGIKIGLGENLNLLLQNSAPIDIINGPLMEAMAKVGVLFNANKLIVAEVLQSAEVMKAAIDHLKPSMKKDDLLSKAKVVLATVKGDVHDIGKNLVDIILSNNGFDVINIGIKVSSDQLIRAVKEHRPDLIGLSGLLVKSTHEMEQTAKDLEAEGITTPLLLGGAALTEKFVKTKIGPSYRNGLAVYAKDAMTGLSLANELITQEGIKKFKDNYQNPLSQECNDRSSALTDTTPIIVSTITNPPKPPFLDRVTEKESPDILFNYINPKMLLGKHLGIKGREINAILENDLDKINTTEEGKKAVEIFQNVKNIFNKYKETHLIAKSTFQFFNTYSKGNELFIMDKAGKTLTSFNFGQNLRGENLVNYLNPAGDSLAIFVVTVGNNISHEAEKLKKQGSYLESHTLSALALELAEAYAEYLHQKIRTLWSISDSPGIKMIDLFQAKYRGKRYSLGYPSCPNLNDQEKIFALLNPKEIGVTLTEGMMMSPEASISAICFHHPEAKYFSGVKL